MHGSSYKQHICPLGSFPYRVAMLCMHMHPLLICESRVVSDRIRNTRKEHPAQSASFMPGLYPVVAPQRNLAFGFNGVIPEAFLYQHTCTGNDIHANT